MGSKRFSVPDFFSLYQGSSWSSLSSTHIWIRPVALPYASISQSSYQ